ncbi:MAG: hypothetical protein R3349_11500 [Geminicoccaceae bacterium]|nr:hypothetical protein [Geminicoccaceae bacterium]
MRDEVRGRRLIAIFLFGLLLFNFPLLRIVDEIEGPGGLPLTVVYLFGAWALIIVLLWRIGGNRRRD